MHNPSLRSQSRSEPAPIMEPRKDASIMGWLEESGRLMEPESQEPTKKDVDGEEDISALLGDDFSKDDSDDDDSDED